ncbi:N-acetylmuramoyl-L-alanine amidase family protein [Brochothrix campestris]|uniref:N-acetylmuramoyl-L-alanine amidase family protein n=1 Tax=Brochothrix campestris TaxID=2757 RepID=UPI001E34CE90|nr:N-acetylmuramoyl-L-alanine amidase [Brochothrix campestris]
MTSSIQKTVGMRSKTTAGTTGYVANWVVTVGENEQAATPTVTSLSEATIVLDPGHGGNDTGAIGNNGTYEKTIALKTAAAIKAQIETTGAKVIMTRTDDSYIGLATRANSTNKHGADAFLSIHFDSTEEPNTASGTSTYYYNDNDQDFATTLNTQLETSMPLENHGIKYGDFQVLRENTAPALLLELGYINNGYDETTIDTDDYRQKVAQAVTNGLINYYAN